MNGPPADRVSGLLRQLSQAAWGMLSLPQPNPIPWPFDYGFAVPLGVLNSPAATPFAEAVLADNELSNLFPTVGQAGRQGAVVASTGHGLVIQVGSLASLLVASAYGWLRGTDEPSGERLAELAVEQLGLVRRLIRGQSVQVPARVGFANVLLPPGSRIETPWGVVRPSTERDEQFVAPELRRERTHTFAPDHTVTIRESGDLVLETAVPLSIRVYGTLEEAPPSLPTRSCEDLDQTSKLVELSFLPALNRDMPMPLAPVWRAVDDPLNYSPVSSWSLPVPGGPAPVELRDSPPLREISTWAQFVGTSYHASIDVAVRRALLSPTARRDQPDTLIDAVVGWENLFGTGAGETTFRISGALAWLLAADRQQRATLQKELAGIYVTRSKILHDENADPQRVGKESRRALEVLVQSLRRLFKDRPDLIPLRDRGQRLMLGL